MDRRFFCRKGTGGKAQIGSDSETALLTTYVPQEHETGEPGNILGLNDPANRIVGAKLFLGRGRREALALRSTATMIWGPEGTTAWSLAYETWISGAFRLEGEVAGTGAPHEGPGCNIAFKGGLSAADRLPFVPMAYRLGLDWKRVGSGFGSPTTPGEVSNIESIPLQGGLSWWVFGLEAGVSQQMENVDRLPDLRKAEVWQTSFDLTFRPGEILTDGSWPFFLDPPDWRLYHGSSCRLEKPWSDGNALKEERTFPVSIFASDRPLAPGSSTGIYRPRRTSTWATVNPSKWI
jgi:hypothetical protein